MRRVEEEVGRRRDGTIADAIAKTAPFVNRVVRASCARIGVCIRETQDLTQEVLAKALSSISALDASRPLRPWMRGIALHTVSRVARKERARLGHERLVASPLWFVEGRELPGVALRRLWEALASFDDEPRRHAMNAEATCVLSHIVAQMPDRQRDVLLSKVVEGETLATIAKRRGVGVATVHRDLTQAFEDLRQLMRWADVPPDGVAHNGNGE